MKKLVLLSLMFMLVISMVNVMGASPPTNQDSDVIVLNMDNDLVVTLDAIDVAVEYTAINAEIGGDSFKLSLNSNVYLVIYIDNKTYIKETIYVNKPYEDVELDLINQPPSTNIYRNTRNTDRYTFKLARDGLRQSCQS